MIAAGYMSKKVVKRPDWLHASGVDNIYFVSGFFSEPFADYINYWNHNGYWFFNSRKDIEQLCQRNQIDASGNTLFYYEVFEKQFNEDTKQ